MDKKILLVSANLEKNPCPVVPAGMIQLKKELDILYGNTELIDFCFMEDIPDKLTLTMEQLKPYIVIFSIRNIDNQSYLNPDFYLAETRKYIQICKRYDCKIIIGGVGAIIGQEAIFNYLKADYAVLDRGLATMCKLIKKLLDNKVPGELEGILYRCDDGRMADYCRLPETQSMYELDWDYILEECDSEYFKYLDRQAPSPLGIRTKYGCNFHCIHCEVPDFESRLEVHSNEYIVKTLKSFEKKGVKRIFITDNEFNSPYEEAINFCHLIIDNHIHLQWSCYLHPRQVDRKLIMAMIEAGCESVQLGIDTASDSLLKLWGKGMSSKDIIHAGTLCNEYKLKNSYSLIIGGPGETTATLIETLNVLKAAGATFIWGILGMRIHLNTPLREWLVHQNKLSREHELLHPEFYIEAEILHNYKSILRNYQEQNPTIKIKIIGE